MSKTILITGAGTGFGRLVGFDLARKGHKVIATVEIWPQVTELQDEAKGQGLNLQVEKLDVTNASDRQHAFRHDIDVLLSNAGLMEAGPIAEQPIERLRSMFEINVFSSIALAQGFVPAMVDKRCGKIVFMSSMAGLWTVPYASGYSASKHALEAVAEGLKTELAPFGIKAPTVEPRENGKLNDERANNIRTLVGRTGDDHRARSTAGRTCERNGITAGPVCSRALAAAEQLGPLGDCV